MGRRYALNKLKRKNGGTINKIQNVGCFYRINNLASYKKKERKENFMM